MKMLLAAALALLAAAPAAQAQTARVAQGEVQGVRQGPVDAFLGLPFAAPPTGPNRWRAPRPPARWAGLRKADRFGASCQQRLAPEGFGPWTREYVVQNEVSEDCLYLNVWTPRERGARRLPVLVWIHGGGFLQGSGSVPIYDGSALAARGMVVVNLNYRLGVFGFLAHPELTREAGASGNYGLQDMVAALKWVQANIASFGGDPAAVTIAGQSAGAAAVHDLIASPSAKGLFVRAIAQSGSGMGIDTPALRDAERAGAQLAEKAGAKSIAALRALPPAAVMKAAEGDTPLAGLRFAPVVDGKVLPRARDALPKGGFHDTPVLTGLTADEGSAMVPGYGKATAAELKTRLEQAFGPSAAKAQAIYGAADDRQAGEFSKALVQDRGVAGAYQWARHRASQSGKRIFLYLFAHPEPGPEAARYGAFHSAEIPYVFQTLDKAPERPFTPQDRRLSETMAAYWTNFVRTGDPNGPGLTPWPAFDPKSPQLMRFDDSAAPQPVLTPEKQAFYDGYTAAGGKLGIF